MVVLLCALSGWSDSGVEQRPNTTEHLIVPRDSLWKLAAQYYADAYQWPKLWELNEQVENPDLIYVGEILRVPADNAKKQAAKSELSAKRELGAQLNEDAVAASSDLGSDQSSSQQTSSDGFRPLTKDNGNRGSTQISRSNIDCLLYTSPSPRDATLSRMPSSA